MKKSDRLEVNIPVPWSSEPAAIVVKGWRCVVVALILATVATVILLN